MTPTEELFKTKIPSALTAGLHKKNKVTGLFCVEIQGSQKYYMDLDAEPAVCAEGTPPRTPLCTVTVTQDAMDKIIKNPMQIMTLINAGHVKISNMTAFKGLLPLLK